MSESWRLDFGPDAAHELCRCRVETSTHVVKHKAEGSLWELSSFRMAVCKVLKFVSIEHIGQREASNPHNVVVLVVGCAQRLF